MVIRVLELLWATEIILFSCILASQFNFLTAVYKGKSEAVKLDPKLGIITLISVLVQCSVAYDSKTIQ